MKAKKVNQSMELCKFIASIFVVFIHFVFPGKFGETVNCIARFAVPVFFAISGYFSYRTDSLRLGKRISHIFKLNVIATFIYFLWAVYYCTSVVDKSVWQMLTEKFSSSAVAKWLIMGINPFSGHLWYLSAIFLCYVLLWVYVRFFEDKADYRPFYAACFGFYMFFLMFSAFTVNEKIQYHYTVYRNGLFFGMPMFGLGMFLREYEDRIVKTLKLSAGKEILCIAFGIITGLIQNKAFGKSEMPAGMIITVIALILLMSQHPRIPFMEKRDSFFIFIGKISLTVYIIHMVFGNYFKTQTAFYEAYSKHAVYPLLIAGLSVGCGVILSSISLVYKNIRGRNGSKSKEIKQLISK